MILPAVLLLAVPLATPSAWRLAEPGRTLDGVAVSSDLRLVAVRVSGGGDAADALATVDLVAGRPGARVSGGGRLGPPAWLPGARLAAVGDDGLLVWSDAGRGARLTWRVDLVVGPLAAARDAHRVAAPARSGGVAVVDARTGQVVARLATRGPVSAVALDDTGETAYTVEAPATGETAGELTAWDVATGARRAGRPVAPQAALVAGRGGLEALGPGGLTAWTGALDPDPLGPATGDLLARSPDGQHWALATRGTTALRLVDRAGGPAAELSLPAPIAGLAYAGLDHLVVAAGDRLLSEPVPSVTVNP